MNLRLLIAALAVGLTSSCKKSSSDVPPSDAKVKSITHSLVSSTYSNSTTYNIIYDANGGITGTQTVPGGKKRNVFTDTGNKRRHELYSNDAVTYFSDAFVIAGTLLVDSLYEINHGLGDTIETKYHYNSANQLISSDGVNHSRFGVDILEHVDYTYDSKGNIAQETHISPEGTYTKSYSYDIAVLWPKATPEGYYPNIQKQVPTKFVFAGRQLDNEVFQEFTFDDKNRLTTITITSVKFPDQTNKTEYTYF